MAKYIETTILRTALTKSGVECSRIYADKHVDGTVRVKAYAARNPKGKISCAAAVRRHLPAGYGVAVVSRDYRPGLISLVLVTK